MASVLGAESAAAIPAARGKDATDKKEKGKRGMIPYNMYVSWISDFAAHNGRHPAIVAVKSANPAVKLGMTFASEFYKTITQEKKDAMTKVFQEFIPIFEQDKAGSAGHGALEAFKKFEEAQHPDKHICKILGLETKPEFKTDPAQMKAEAAEARRHADGAAAGGPSATPLPATAAVGKLDFSSVPHDGPNGNGAAMQVDQREEEGTEDEQPPAPTPAKSDKDGKGKSEKGKGKRKAEEGAAAATGAAATDASAKKDEKEPKQKKHKKDKGEAAKTEAPAVDDSAVKSDKKSEKKKDKSEKKSEKKKEKKEKRDKGDKAE